MNAVATARRFPLGRVVATPGALRLLAAHGHTPSEFLARHARGDWGDVPPADAQANDSALIQGSRLLSAYPVGNRGIWIITEADRQVTTVLLPEEY